MTFDNYKKTLQKQYAFYGGITFPLTDEEVEHLRATGMGVSFAVDVAFDVDNGHDIHDALSMFTD